MKDGGGRLEKGRKLWQEASRKVKTKHLCLVALVLFTLSLVPLLLVARYDHPSADDYRFGRDARAVYSETGSVGGAIAAAGRTTASVFKNWQGTYSACFAMALQPAVFGTQHYGATTWLMLAALVGGTGMLCWVLLKRVLKADGWTAGFVTLLMLFVTVQQVPDTTQAFYWFNGAVYYTFFHGLARMLLACVLLAATAKTTGEMVGALAVSVLLAVLVGGANYVTGAYLLMALAVLVVALAVLKNKRWKAAVVPLVVLVVCYGISVAAPGNAVRQAQYTERLSFFGAVKESFLNSFFFGRRWLQFGLLLSLLLMVPYFWELAGKLTCRFRLPLLVTAVSLCCFAAGFFPNLYATNTETPPRMLNIMYYTYVFLAAGNVFYWLGWLRRKTEGYHKNGLALAQRAAEYGRRNRLAFVGLFAAGLLAVVVLQAEPFATIEAARPLYNGEAAAFDAEMREREALMEQAPGDEVEVPALSHTPAPLFTWDIGADASEVNNRYFANFYGKKAAVAVPMGDEAMA